MRVSHVDLATRKLYLQQVGGVVPDGHPVLRAIRCLLSCLEGWPRSLARGSGTEVQSSRRGAA